MFSFWEIGESDKQFQTQKLRFWQKVWILFFSNFFSGKRKAVLKKNRELD